MIESILSGKTKIIERMSARQPELSVKEYFLSLNQGFCF